MTSKRLAYSSDFGAYLKSAREKAGLTQLEVAKRLGLASAQCISDWERNRGSSIPGKYLKRLIGWYHLDVMETFERLFAYQSAKLRERLAKEILSR
jgi:transcriptional regulator with XRE-family HTH domain